MSLEILRFKPCWDSFSNCPIAKLFLVAAELKTLHASAWFHNIFSSKLYTFLSCMFCFRNTDHVMFFRKFAFCLFMYYAYIDSDVDARA